MNNMNRDLWYTIWGVGLALAIQVLYNGINEYPDLSRGFWFGLVIECFILAILMLIKGGSLAVERKEEMKTKEEAKKPDNDSLIAEYQVLNKAVQRRGSDTLLVDSIMIPSSLALVTFAIQFRNELGRNNLTGLPNALFIPLLSLILILIPYLLWCTSTKLDNICFDRMCEIEKDLHIKGHQYIRERTKCRIWFKIRRNMWHVFFLLFIGAYLFTAYWLFTETIIV